MTRLVPVALLTLAAIPAHAQTDREMSAHEHGSGILNIAFQGNQVLIELEAPGADIVGFEHEAESDADKATLDAALMQLQAPLEIVVPDDEAGCRVVESSVELAGDDHEHDEDHDDHDDDHGDADHDDHDDDHDDADHDEHGEDHDDADHDEHDHDDEDHADEETHAHDDHDDGGEAHSEFHVTYQLTCDQPARLTGLTLGYFAAFPNAEELEVQVISDKGTFGAEVTRDAPILDLNGKI